MKVISVLYTLLLVRIYASNRFRILGKGKQDNAVADNKSLGSSSEESLPEKDATTATPTSRKNPINEGFREYTMDDMLEELEKYTEIGDEHGVVLDISDLKNGDIDIINKNYPGITYKRYVPKVGIYIKSVLDSGSELWNAAEGEKCNAVTLSSGKGMITATLDIKHSNKMEYVRFKKVNGVWKNITRRI
ncbi:signal peptide-containing protein [Theileria equi strain WA]|uniref:Signal peptide-containing protein n=1 Tax=Theileria equi strain WA TaxID=1537102 RepID=L0B2J0_THEEQ|nr:signal peptide-containing protein [Theileria equi strain WA]AFZ81426.1 signal peptide-containing protein [Theileria equi strain WA]|eukprot:XP_004831092.1 signal peptide-containing protein [Theileria equi strain WA]